MADPEPTGGRGRAGGRGRMARGAAFAGLLAMPLVGVAHACAVVWLYNNLGSMTFLVLLLPLILTAVILAWAVVLLWLAMDTAGNTPAVAVVTGLGGLMCAYLFTYHGAADWMLRWQGTETSCVVLGVEERRELDPLAAIETDTDSGWVTRYDYELNCDDDDAPGRMTADNGNLPTAGHGLSPGWTTAVVYDPSPAWGAWGAAPAAELEPGNDMMGLSAGFVISGTGLWTLSLLGSAAACVRGTRRSR